MPQVPACTAKFIGKPRLAGTVFFSSWTLCEGPALLLVRFTDLERWGEWATTMPLSFMLRWASDPPFSRTGTFNVT